MVYRHDLLGAVDLREGRVAVLGGENAIEERMLSRREYYLMGPSTSSAITLDRSDLGVDELRAALGAMELRKVRIAMPKGENLMKERLLSGTECDQGGNLFDGTLHARDKRSVITLTL